MLQLKFILSVILLFSITVTLFSSRAYFFHPFGNLLLEKDQREKDVSELTQAIYEKHIQTGFIARHFALPWWQKVWEAYPNATTWLEAGCGECGLIKKLLGKDINAMGVEVSKAAISRGCPDLVQDRRVVQGSLVNIPFASRQFDLVFSSEVLEHIPEQDIPGTIKELCRVSRGELFLSISLRRSLLDPKPPEPAIVHVTVKTREWWNEQFRKHAGCIPNTSIFARLQETVEHRPNGAPWFFPFTCQRNCSG
jgi:ubiquinone/menaquinone biosynthesis C-methylase UbiE